MSGYPRCPSCGSGAAVVTYDGGTMVCQNGHHYWQCHKCGKLSLGEGGSIPFTCFVCRAREQPDIASEMWNIRPHNAF